VNKAFGWAARAFGAPLNFGKVRGSLRTGTELLLLRAEGYGWRFGKSVAVRGAAKARTRDPPRRDYLVTGQGSCGLLPCPRYA